MNVRWLYTSSGGTGYVNQGPDRRIGGLVGTVLAWTQRTLSFHSETAPRWWIWRPRPNWKIGLEWSRPATWYRPWLPFLLVFVPRRRSYRDLVEPQRWWSFRAGWRWDVNWGRGGYIADIIVKSRIDNIAE